ncbi:FecCD family ABC transporter permease [Massiliimalia massiliensis]|uniref:FecCD family ABC transporter permease n=1 Tax=Massiliimalia massiliensis TaxID=1852384 RepID=UPI001E5F1050|nr:iron ABC transporter permease [Massiliimalia massiliensis]
MGEKTAMLHRGTGAYAGYIRKKVLLIIILAVVMLFIALISIASGSSELGLGEVVAALMGKGGQQTRMIVFNIRLPRVVTAVVAGIGLAAVGCVLQSILKNPLASASTLGVSQGAAFGAAFSIIVLGTGTQSQTLDGITISNPYLISVCAFAGSILSTMVILGLSRIKRVTPESMVLTGVALSSLFSGGTALLQYFADDVKVSAVVFWTYGNLGATSWREILIMSLVVMLALIYFSLNRWNYNALQSGESTAKGLGVNVESIQIVNMVVCAVTASTIVSYIGIINFIGLIAPHLVRRLIGSDYRYLLPASALMGAILLLLSDTVSRLIAAPIILPIGAITSFLGAPLFLYLIFKGVKRR